MNRDNVYIFDKITFERSLLGEIQTDFNMSFTIDGTKDSLTIIVRNYSDLEVEPMTILWHEKTQTWWVVSHDKVEKYMNEDGFCYTHNLDLLGAIDLLNARDLIDCGFNDKTYTIREFIDRLFSLSTFEYEYAYNTQLQLYNEVDFIKTFENYTLLSALREFLDAYNSCGKLTFATRTQGNKVYIDHAILNILLKTGNSNLTSHNIDFFDDVKEIKNIDKNSYGACVVSNANNVVSTQAKTYPSNGFKELSGTEYEITTANAVLRLPSNVYKVNWLKLIATRVHITFNVDNVFISVTNLVYEADEYSKARIIARLNSALEREDITQESYDHIMNIGIDFIWKKAKEYHTVTFYTDIQYNPNDTYTLGANAPYIPIVTPSVTGDPQKVTLLPKDIRDCVQKHGDRIFAMYWERGSNLIRGFEWLEHNHRVAFNYTDGYYNEDSVAAKVYEDDLVKIYARDTSVPSQYLNFAFRAYDTNRQPALFRINYIPMADIKLKVDNQRDKKDIQLYNQNGKLSDSYALSKLLNSYSKEISSDNIVRYKSFYDFNDIPKVGSFVVNGKETYVINNVSMNFKQNEHSGSEFGYFVDCEFNMCKWVSTKSLMVSPNSNIRDYGIPQQYNVSRKQLYRDYYELSYDFYDNSNQDEPYLTLERVLPFGNQYVESEQYIAMIKIGYDEQVGETEPSDTWYYQLDCSTLILNKQIVVHCGFMDNNIVGYSSMNRDFIFDVSHLFDQWSKINTPISYTDDKGRFKDIELLFLNEEEKSSVDYEYFGQQPEPYDALLTQCFIPEELYELGEENYSFKISEENYKKDALEVPVFEYICQVDDSEDVLIGDNILQQYEDCIYFYHLVIGDQGEVMTTNTVWDQNNVVVRELEPIMEMGNVVMITYNSGDNEIRLTRYQKAEYNKETNEYGFTNQIPFPTGVDICVYRHAINKNAEYDSDDYEYHKEPILICKNVSEENIFEDILVLKINHYRLN